MIEQLQIISNPDLLKKVNHFIDHERHPDWDSDYNDGEWSIPESKVHSMLIEIIEHYEGRLKAIEDNSLG
jgi:hypothetical protein